MSVFMDLVRESLEELSRIDATAADAAGKEIDDLLSLEHAAVPPSRRSVEWSLLNIFLSAPAPIATRFERFVPVFGVRQGVDDPAEDGQLAELFDALRLIRNRQMERHPATPGDLIVAWLEEPGARQASRDGGNDGSDGRDAAGTTNKSTDEVKG